MESLIRFDQASIILVERSCQRIEAMTGMSNFSWFRLLMAICAAGVMYLIGVKEIFRIGTDTWGNVILAVLAGWLCYMSIVYGTKAERLARERMKEGMLNWMRYDRAYRMLRLTMLVAFIACTAALSTLALHLGSARIAADGYGFIFATCATPLIFWLCLVLDVCDPLPRKKLPA